MKETWAALYMRTDLLILLAWYLIEEDPEGTVGKVMLDIGQDLSYIHSCLLFCEFFIHGAGRS